MLKTKIKKLVFSSIFFFLFFNMFIPVSFANWCTDLGGELSGMNLCYCPNGTPTMGKQCSSSTTSSGSTTTNSGSTTTSDSSTTTSSGSTATTGGADYGGSTTTTSSGSTTSESSSGTGLVKCGNEGQAACTFNDFIDMINGVIQFIMTSIVPPIAIVTIVIAAVNLMTSSGDPGKLEQAKKTIIWIIFGLVVIYGAWAIVRGFITALGGGGDALQFFKQ